MVRHLILLHCSLLSIVCGQDDTDTPKVETVSFESSHKCNKSFLVAGHDYSVLVLKISGPYSNLYTELNEDYGPSFRYSTPTNADAFGCSGFKDDVCESSKGAADACSCEQLESEGVSNVYKLSFNRTARLESSKMSVWIAWPGPPPYVSEKYSFPEIEKELPKSCMPPKANKPKVKKQSSSSTGVAVVVTLVVLFLLATAAGVGFMYSRKIDDPDGEEKPSIRVFGRKLPSFLTPKSKGSPWERFLSLFGQG